MFWNWFNNSKFLKKCIEIDWQKIFFFEKKHWNWLKIWNLKRKNIVCYWKKWISLIKILLPKIGHCLLSLYLIQILEKEKVCLIFLRQIKLNSVNFNNVVLICMIFYCCIIMAPTAWWLMWSQLSISVTIQITWQQLSLGIWTDTINYKKLNK